MSKSITYSDAGVSIDAANAAVERIKKLARGTFNARTLSEIGTFGGMFDGAFPGMSEPVLVASADGVGTKLKIAFMTGVHDTVGRDLVNHCTNDILVQGARPLFFLDYVATGSLSPEVIVAVVEGVARGCRENACVLLGGETAEMPGFYPAGEYDVAGFIVGVVEREKAFDGSRVAVGDVVLALPSAGLHTNGYSLARKLFFEVAGYKVDTHPDALGMNVGEALLQPHLSYLRPLEGLLDTGQIKALAHITGGGLVENIPRVLPEGVGVEVERGSWPVLPVFKLMQEIGNVAESEMHRTFNMGVGMVVICAGADADAIEKHLAALNEKCYRIGRVVEGGREVRIV
ncbi:MAG TPA: phosphoribosylformylglycinamidine cyclo-ligase [Pyrinomonadaceae bacterium]|jgi:phosphoribosylformylglycinamidine cyclo-ligase|nr:phosphoribosylformylglycinamidine cyclo-ligase [Pyrinomonadaceae bacterium]